MAGWLFTTTRYAAANARKMSQRRRYHEQQAMKSAERAGTVAESHDPDIDALLDDAIESLPKIDRQCVVMSYLQQKSNHQIAAALGVSDDAARMRIARAIGRLREFFRLRGVTAGGAVAVTSLAPIKAPAALVASTLNVAVLSQSAAGTSAAAAIVKGVTHMIFATQLKLAAAASIALLFTGLVTAQVIRHLIPPAIIPGMALQATTQPEITSDSVSFDDGVKVRFTGIAKLPPGADGWHTLDGKSAPAPGGPNLSRMRITPMPNYQAIIQVDAPDDAMVISSVPQSNTTGTAQSGGPGHRSFGLGFLVKDAATSIDLDVRIADGPWKTVITSRPVDSVAALGRDEIGVILTPLLQHNGKTVMYVSVTGTDGPWRLVGKETTGEMFVPRSNGGVGTGKMVTTEYEFDQPPELVQSLEIQIRPYSKHVIAHDVTLDPAKPTTPRIEIVNQAAK